MLHPIRFALAVFLWHDGQLAGSMIVEAPDGYMMVCVVFPASLWLHRLCSGMMGSWQAASVIRDVFIISGILCPNFGYKQYSL